MTKVVNFYKSKKFVSFIKSFCFKVSVVNENIFYILCYARNFPDQSKDNKIIITIKFFGLKYFKNRAFCWGHKTNNQKVSF